MTDARFFVAPGTIPEPGGTLELTGSEGKHAATVMRIGAGERVLISDGAHVSAAAHVLAAAPGTLTLEVVSRSDIAARAPRLVLIQALAKGDRDEMAVEAATELGVDAVMPWQADRSISQWRGAKIVKGREKWQSVVFAAAKQSRRATVPEVHELVTSKQLCAWVAVGAGATGATHVKTLVLHESHEHGVSDVKLPESGTIAVVVGPEGGISPGELDALVSAGATIVRLGPEVLRASTAGPAAISALSLRLARW